MGINLLLLSMFYTQAPKTGGPHTRRGQVRRPPAQHRTAPEPRCPQLTGPGTLPLLPPPPPHEQGVGCTMLGAPSRCGVHADFHGTYVREPPAYPNSYVPRAGTTLALEGIAVATVVAASLMDFTVVERNCQITPYMGSFSAYFSPTHGNFAGAGKLPVHGVVRGQAGHGNQQSTKGAALPNPDSGPLPTCRQPTPPPSPIHVPERHLTCGGEGRDPVCRWAPLDSVATKNSSGR